MSHYRIVNLIFKIIVWLFPHKAHLSRKWLNCMSWLSKFRLILEYYDCIVFNYNVMFFIIGIIIDLLWANELDLNGVITMPVYWMVQDRMMRLANGVFFLSSLAKFISPPSMKVHKYICINDRPWNQRSKAYYILSIYI